MFTFSGKFMPAEFWAEAISTANYLRNLVPVSTATKTPYELLYQTVPDVACLRVFGCSAHVQVPAQLRKKLDKRSIQGVFVGYEKNQKAWRVMCSTEYGRWKLHTSRDVQFVEHLHGIEALRKPQEDDDYINIDAWLAQEIEDRNTGVETDVSVAQQVPFGGENGGEVIEEENLSTENSVQQEEEEGEASSADISEQQQPPVRRSSRVCAAPDRYDPAAYANSAEPSPTDEPKTLRGVRMRPDADLWDQAMQEELTALWEKGVYEWVDVPTHKRVLPAKWVYKIKRDKKGAIGKYKARLVAKGILQKPGVDYGEVFAPASSLVTLRLLLSIAAEKDCDVRQLDVKTAFLNGDLEEEVYLQPPEGYEDKQGRVWLLKKALYSLQQAAQAWHKKLKDSLVKVGLHPSESDPCLIIEQFNDGCAVYVLIHVDDALIVGSSAAVREVKSKFSSLFEVRDLGEEVFFLGLEILRDRTAGTLWLGQSQYAEKKLEQFGMRDCNSRVTPLEVNQQLGPDGETLQSNMPYSEVVGSLLYLAVCTRPDMSHSVGMLSRFVSVPKL
jgi:hypothetical protein